LNFTEARPFSSHPLHVVSESVVFTADASKATAIIVPCADAKIAQALSVFRPDTPIFAFSSDKRAVRMLRMSYGVHSKFVEGANEIELLKNGLKQIELTETDRIVVVTPENGDPASFDIDVITVAQALKK
jgi:pyruvate kinase